MVSLTGTEKYSVLINPCFYSIEGLNLMCHITSDHLEQWEGGLVVRGQILQVNVPVVPRMPLFGGTAPQNVVGARWAWPSPVRAVNTRLQTGSPSTCPQLGLRATLCPPARITRPNKKNPGRAAPPGESGCPVATRLEWCTVTRRRRQIAGTRADPVTLCKAEGEGGVHGFPLNM